MHVNEYYTRIAGSSTIEKVKDHTIEFLRSHCYKPKYIKIYDAYINQYRTIQVDCGNCYHCRMRKQNEWVTRLYAHAEDFKYVYFVTLTYKSVYSLTADSLFYMDYFKDALFHYDNKNKTGRYCWRPCVLVKKHYQDFMKRLRKITCLDDITYFINGEYGHNFGAPHFHLVLYSNSPILKSQIQRAWSALVVTDESGHTRRARRDSVNKIRTLSFGRVDYHDLVANGSFDTGSKEETALADKYNARNCFAYVAKYLCKSEYPIKRVKIAFDSLKIVENPQIIDDWSSVSKTGFTTFQHENHANVLGVEVTDINLFTQNLKLYETFNFFDSCLLGRLDLPLISDSAFFGKGRKLMFKSFCSSYRPFVSVSRGTPIGSLYFKTHLQDILAGKIDSPALQKQGFIAPRYFIRKAREIVYGFREFSTQAKTPTFAKANISAFGQDFLACSSGCSPKFLRVVPDNFSSDYQLFNSRYCYKDNATGERILFRYCAHVDAQDFTTLLLALHYKYNRSTRTYDFVRATDIGDFCKYWYQRFEESLKQHLDEVSLSNAQSEKMVSVQKIVNDKFCLLDEDSAYHAILADCYEKIVSDDLNTQIEYNRRHNHLD